MNNEVLEKFLNTGIDRETLACELGGNPIYMKSDTPAIVNGDHIKYLLGMFQQKQIDFKTLIDWCDVIRFSELYDYPDDEMEQEVLSSIVDEIQDFEDANCQISDEDIEKWIKLMV